MSENKFGRIIEKTFMKMTGNPRRELGCYFFSLMMISGQPCLIGTQLFFIINLILKNNVKSNYE
jgi:hypothetical protein